MSLTLLLDLDETLLGNPPEQFVQAYFQKLATHLEPYAEPQALIQALNAGMHQMVQNLLPDCSLQEVFESVFYPSLHLLPQDIEQHISRFYAEIFPTLKDITYPMPGAVEFIERAFQCGYQVAIATTPLFPLTAGMQRLEWANISAQKYPYDLVSSFDQFHFAKPHPAFFAEALAKMGWPENPVLVVGDDPFYDIQPAQALGLSTYWVHRNRASQPSLAVPPNGSGDLVDLLTWLEDVPLESLKPQFESPSALQAILRATPAALNSMCKALDLQIWTLGRQPGEWSPTEILCHLRDVDTELNLPRLRKILSEHNPFLPGVNSDQWASEREYIKQDGQSALKHFVRDRMKVLDLLQTLSNHDWGRPARHSIFGPTHLKELVAFMAGHDQLHLRQMKETLARI